MEQKSFFESSNGIFAFGLVAGIAIALLISSITGAAPKTKNRAANTQPTQVVQDNGQGALEPAGAKVLAPVTEDDHILGDIDKADVVIVEYSDFECPFCERHHPTLQQVVDEYGDQVAWVYRHLPLSFHQNAQPAALASECAAEQGAFWEYSDELFANQATLGPALYDQIAADLGLDTGDFSTCMDEQRYAADVAEDLASAQAAGATGTPATFINGQLVSGAVPYANIKQIVDAAIAGDL